MIKLKNLHTFRDSAGKFRCYVRRAGAAKIPIPGKIGSPKFMTAYRAAMRSQKKAPHKPVALPTGPLTYFLAAGNFIKIGTTRTGFKRIQQIQTSSSVKLDVLLTLSGGPKLERSLHTKFSRLRVNGEWFAAGPELLSFIEDEQGKRRTAMANTSEKIG